jgi:hypothetical protein
MTFSLAEVPSTTGGHLLVLPLATLQGRWVSVCLSVYGPVAS